MNRRRVQIRPPEVIAIDAGAHRERFLAWRNELVEEHLPLVPPIARRVQAQLPPSFDLDDLIAVGNLELLHLATRYRPLEHGGSPFAAFARPRLRGAMLDSIRRGEFEQQTRPPLAREDEDRDEAVADHHAARIEISIDEGRLRKRLREAIQGLPQRQQAVVAAYYADVLTRSLRDGAGCFQRIDHLACVGSALGLPEWRVIREHSEVIEELRRKLAI